MTRTTQRLDGTWTLYLDPTQHLTHTTIGNQDGRAVAVPGPIQAQFDDLRDYRGVMWYRHTFDISAENRSQITDPNQVTTQASTHSGGGNLQSATWLLRFGAVDYYTSVWLNGQHLGDHEGGYLPFEFVADAAIRLDGANELVVRVIDPDEDEERFPQFTFAEIPHGKQSWYGPLSGIWQSVTLEARAATHIARLQITPDVASECTHVVLHLNQAAPARHGLLLALTDPQGHTTYQRSIVAAGAQQHAVEVPVPQPMLWDTRTPHLYRLEAVLQPDGREEALDSLADHFGMRSIATSPDGHLMLNGRVLYLRGALDQDYYPALIYTPFSDAELDDQFAKAKHMGLNCLRTHIKITDPRYYDAADRAGLLIWTELPNWENLTEGAKRRARDTLTGMVARDWNHPSIIIWTIINEGWGVDLAVNADHRAWLGETYDYLKQLDPHRLVVGNSPCFTNFHVVTDIEDFHNYYAIPDHYRQWRQWVETFASRPPWTFAYTYERFESWKEALRDPWNPLPRTAAPEVRRRGNEPMVVSEFGNWGLPDVDKLKACYGGEPWWFESGIEWGDGVVYPHAVERRFRAFHLDKAFPTLSDLAAASQRMQFTALKYQIEQMRRHQNIVGYIITEFTDVHWESNGLLDMCRNPKAFYDVIGNVNSADAIIPDWERVVFWEGERCEVRLGLSHFSHWEVQGCRLEWSVDLWPGVGGAFEDVHVGHGHVLPIGTVGFEVPPVAASARARLELRLLDPQGQLITSNHHEFYVFPRTLAAPAQELGQPLQLYATGTVAERLAACGYGVADSLRGSDLAVVDTMTDDLRWYLQNGGRVLWLAEAGHAMQTYLGSLNIAQRQGRSWQGDWASSMSWLRQDKMFGNIPTGGVVDFAFADLTPDYVIVGMRPSDFGADVHAGLFVGWIHHVVALVAERRFGNGLLLTSTFRLGEHMVTNPVARIMLNDLLRYLAK